MHVLNLVVGDWSTDGHSHTDTVTIRSNLSSKRLETAYRKGSEKIGFDLTRDVATNFEDASLPKDVVEKLLAVGYDLDGNVGKYEGKWDNLSYENFADIWLFVARLGSPNFRYAKVEDNENVNIGGYGLWQP